MPFAFFTPGARDYQEAIQSTWRHTCSPPDLNRFPLQRELVRYATLAPSSHNTQCWRFHVQERLIKIMPDYARRCPVVDPEDHHLFVSLGCALENLLLAARAWGLQGEPLYDPTTESLSIALQPCAPVSSQLFSAIPMRQWSRTVYNAQPVTSADLKCLEAVADNDVEILILTAKQEMEDILDYVIQGNTIQIHTPAFVQELKSWIRFSYAEVLQQRDGLFAGSSGNPVVPRWLGSRLFHLMFQARSENDKCAHQVRSSAGMAIFIARGTHPASWIKVGQCYERFALQATALGIRNAFLNQPVEVASLRPDFASYLGLPDRRPNLVVRFGYGPG